MTATPADVGLPALLRRAMADDPGRPFVTYYDDNPTGGRIELSWTTLENWVAKSANMLRDGMAMAPGDRIVLALPEHWQTAVLLLASAAVGAHTVLAHPADRAAALAAVAGAEVAVAGPDLLAEVIAQRPGEVVGLSLAPLGNRLADLPAGALDYAVEVPAYGDTFAAAPVDEAAATLEVDGTIRSGPQTAAAAEATAVRWSLGRADRVLSTLAWTSWSGLLAGLLAPLAAGAGAVLCRGGDLPPQRLAEERVTAIVGQPPPSGSALRRLDG